MTEWYFIRDSLDPQRRVQRWSHDIIVLMFDTKVMLCQVFDQGVLRFPLGHGHVIKGWDLGLVGITVNETRKLTIPPHLAYGERCLTDSNDGSSFFLACQAVEIA